MNNTIYVILAGLSKCSLFKKELESVDREEINDKLYYVILAGLKHLGCSKFLTTYLKPYLLEHTFGNDSIILLHKLHESIAYPIEVKISGSISTPMDKTLLAVYRGYASDLKIPGKGHRIYMSAVSKVLNVTSLSQFSCDKCDYSNDLVDNSFGLSLPINSDDKTLSGCFRKMMEVKECPDYKCSNCHQNATHRQRISLALVSPLIIISLDRNNHTKSYDNTPIEYPTSLSLRPYLHPHLTSMGKDDYNLMAVACLSDHYYLIYRNDPGSDRWYRLYNDEISSVDSHQTPDAIGFFYQTEKGEFGISKLIQLFSKAQNKYEADQCCICYEEFKKDSKVHENGCGHIFHYECWMDYTEFTTHRHPPCPMCRM